MINSGYVNPIKNFQSSGIKTVGSYEYVLLIDLAGQVLILRRKDDDTEIKFTKKTTGTIEAFWADPTAHSYVWIHEV